MTYDVRGLESALTYPSGLKIVYEHDEIGRLTAMTTRNPSVVPELSYTVTYDAAGQVVGITDGTEEHVYAYDAAGRLTAADHPDGGPLVDEWYAYDALGRRTASHLSAVYSYDAAGRLLADDTYAYEHDANGQMTAITEPAEDFRLELAYDAAGLLAELRQRQATSGDVIAALVYARDGEGRMAFVEETPAGTTRQDFRDGQNLVLTRYGDGAEERYVHAEGIDVPLAAVSGDGAVALVRNAREDVVGIIDAGGGLADTYVYDSFGRTDDSVAPVRFGFGSRERRTFGRVELYDLRARLFVPWLGAFTSRDPAGGSAIAEYAYVRGAPLMQRDPLGRYELHQSANPFTGKIEAAIAMLRQAFANNPREACECTNYFSSQKNSAYHDVDKWLSPGGYPNIVAALPTGNELGWAMGTPPFSNLYISTKLLDKMPPDICTIASVISHEVGHLSRKDEKGNEREPKEFFEACTFSGGGCINPTYK
ncbi:MAG: hypothetical protein HYV63_14090 [Candidatus Schekmanbacteria bacterium]|nr:hypothetical protein [Candidatus Schekmanbacteria bacterium]